MRAPHFLRLAEIDERRFINACRHGLVHLTWSRITLRFSRDEFRRLAGLLARSADTLPPSSARDGRMQVTCTSDGGCELQLGSLRLALSPDEFHAFAGPSRRPWSNWTRSSTPACGTRKSRRTRHPPSSSTFAGTGFPRTSGIARSAIFGGLDAASGSVNCTEGDPVHAGLSLPLRGSMPAPITW